MTSTGRHHMKESGALPIFCIFANEALVFVFGLSSFCVWLILSALCILTFFVFHHYRLHRSVYDTITCRKLFKSEKNEAACCKMRCIFFTEKWHWAWWAGKFPDLSSQWLHLKTKSTTIVCRTVYEAVLKALRCCSRMEWCFNNNNNRSSKQKNKCKVQ